jgi:acyl-CoA reductase-like NAD-dependent aldehyde dehydrogenase
MDFLKELGIEQNNPGAYFGDGEWSQTTDMGVIDCYNPSTGEVIANVWSASDADYERVMEKARSVFAEWRKVPAPARGDAVRATRFAYVPMLCESIRMLWEAWSHWRTAKSKPKVTAKFRK